MLVAVGRGPQTEGLGYAEAGVEMDRGFVAVNERLETSLPGVYAVGDIVVGLQLAHRGFAHGIFVAEDIAHRLGRLGTGTGADPGPGHPPGDLQRSGDRLGGASEERPGKRSARSRR